MDCSFPTYLNHNHTFLPKRSSHETGLSSMESKCYQIVQSFCLGTTLSCCCLTTEFTAQQWDGLNNAQALTTFDASEEQDAVIDYDQYLGSGMRLQDQVWPVNTNRDMDSVVPYHVPSPYNANLTDTSTSMPCLPANSYFLKYVLLKITTLFPS